MDTTDELVIELSKNKIVLLIVGSCAFVALGVWLSVDAESIVPESPIKDPLFVRGAGLAGIIFFGFCGVYGIKKLFDKRPGLVLNSSGIIDNSSAIAAGFIPWSEILGAEIFQIYRQKMLIIKVRDPEMYIARGSALKRMLNRANHKTCGSPIAITSNSLKIAFPELLSTFEQYHQKFGQSLSLGHHSE